jgi:hypothetical protein
MLVADLEGHGKQSMAASPRAKPSGVAAWQARRHRHGPTTRARAASSSFYTIAESSPKDKARWAVAAVIILGAVGWVGYRAATATTAYAYRLTYASMPADDEALAAWLSAQPGVSAQSVTREGVALAVRFGRSAFSSGAVKKQPALSCPCGHESAGGGTSSAAGPTSRRRAAGRSWRCP